MSILNKNSVKTKPVITYYIIISVFIALVVLVECFFLIKTGKPPEQISVGLPDKIIISAILIVILIVFIPHYRKIVLGYLKVKNQLDILNNAFKNIKDIEQFKHEYANIGKIISKDEHLFDLWWEFCETLIIKRQFKDGKDPHRFDIQNNPITELKNTAQVELYINENNIIESQISRSYMEAIPGVLTGLGLVGTFTAIAFALFGFDIKNMDASINTLLSGLSVKFISSLAGILTSIAFIFITVILFTSMKNDLYRLQKKLNKLFPRITSEAYLCNILEETSKNNECLSDIMQEIKEQSDNFKYFLTDMNFTDAIKNAVSDSLSKEKPDLIDAINVSIDKLDEIKCETFSKLETIKDEMISTLNNLNTGISSSISSSMRESLQNLDANLGSAIASLSESMETFKNLKQQSSADILDKMVSELKKCMTDMRESFQNQILDGSGDTIKSLQNNLKDASNYLAGVQGTFSGFMEELLAQQQQENKIRNEAVSQTINSTVQRVSAVNQSIQQSIESQNVQLNDWLHTIKTYIDEIHDNEKNVKNNYSEVLSKLETSLQTQTTTIDNLTYASEAIIESSDKLEKSTSRIVDISTSTSLVADNIADSLYASSELVTKLNSTIQLSKDSLINIQNTLVKLNNALVTNISNFADKSHEFQEQMFKDFTGNLNNLVHNLKIAVDEQKEIIEELSEQLDRIHH